MKATMLKPLPAPRRRVITTEDGDRAELPLVIQGNGKTAHAITPRELTPGEDETPAAQVADLWWWLPYALIAAVFVSGILLGHRFT